MVNISARDGVKIILDTEKEIKDRRKSFCNTLASETEKKNQEATINTQYSFFKVFLNSSDKMNMRKKSAIQTHGKFL